MVTLSHFGAMSHGLQTPQSTSHVWQFSVSSQTLFGQSDGAPPAPDDAVAFVDIVLQLHEPKPEPSARQACVPSMSPKHLQLVWWPGTHAWLVPPPAPVAVVVSEEPHAVNAPVSARSPRGRKRRNVIAGEYHSIAGCAFFRRSMGGPSPAPAAVGFRIFSRWGMRR